MDAAALNCPMCSVAAIVSRRHGLHSRSEEANEVPIIWSHAARSPAATFAQVHSTSIGCVIIQMSIC